MTGILDFSFAHDVVVFSWKWQFDCFSSVFKDRFSLGYWVIHLINSAKYFILIGLYIKYVPTFLTWSLLQCPRHRLHPPSSCGQGLPISSSSSTPTPSWGMDQSSGGKSSIEPASPRWLRLTVWARLPIRFGIWSQTQSTASVSCSLGLGRGAPEHRGRLWSAGPSVQVSQTKHWIILHGSEANHNLRCKRRGRAAPAAEILSVVLGKARQARV